MLKKLAALILLATVSAGHSATLYDYFIVTTNAPTTNHMRLIADASTRTFTNSVTTPATEISTNATIGGNTTNIFRHLGDYPFAGQQMAFITATNVVRLTFTNSVTFSIVGNWGTVTNTSRSGDSMRALRVPASAESTSIRTNDWSLAVTGINDYSTNAFNQAALALAQVVGISNTQAVTNKTFRVSVFDGGTLTNNVITNAQYIGGTLSTVSNGTIRGSVATNLAGLYGTNGLFYSLFTRDLTATNFVAGIPTGDHTAQFHTNSSGSVVLGFPDYDSGWGIIVNPTNNFQIYNGSTTAEFYITPQGTVVTPGYISASNGTNATQMPTKGYVDTNHLSTNNSFYGISTNAGEWADLRYDNTALANGANAAVTNGGKLYIKVSGPTAAFTINGIAGGRNGLEVEIQNSTGYAMTIAHDSGVDPVAANRILTGTGADITYTNNPTLLEFRYDSSVSRWVPKTVTASAIAGVTSVGAAANSQFNAATAVTGSGNLNLSLKDGVTLTNPVLSASGAFNANAGRITNVADIYYNTNGLPTAATKINGVKVYRALVSQAFGTTDAPTATVLENTLGGTVVWSRVSGGLYDATLSGAFTASKTLVFCGLNKISQSDSENYAYAVRQSDNAVRLLIENDTHSGVDGFNNLSFEILVYP